MRRGPSTAVRVGRKEAKLREIAGHPMSKMRLEGSKAACSFLRTPIPLLPAGQTSASHSASQCLSFCISKTGSQITW